jgi:hypothetical protein
MRSTKAAAKPNAKTKTTPKPSARKSPRKSPHAASSAKASATADARKTADATKTKPVGVTHLPRPRSDDADAFIRDPEGGPAHMRDDLANMLGEDFIEGATQGDEALDDQLDRTEPAEIGGPFIVTRARDELAFDVDASNPVGATAEPIPRPTAGLVQRSVAEELEELEELEEEDQRAERSQTKPRVR